MSGPEITAKMIDKEDGKRGMNAKAIMQAHWIGFCFLLPFVVMLVVHHVLGLSDVMMVQTPPGEGEARTYNMIMAAVFYLGIAAYVVHAVKFARPGNAWLLIKLITLGIYWWAILMLQ